MTREVAARSVIQVGPLGGRGFVVEGDDKRYVITAAHCLPDLPASDGEGKTYRKLLAPLGTERTVAALCMFVNPVDDIAVLGPPDGQRQFKECEAYEKLVDEVTPLTIRRPRKNARAWLLSLEGHWFRCQVESFPHGISIMGAEEPIRGGMLGSPILADDGNVISIICTLGGSAEEDEREGVSPLLTACLPVRLWKEMTAKKAK